jgi:hypothetical protein
MGLFCGDLGILILFLLLTDTFTQVLQEPLVQSDLPKSPTHD